MNQLSMEKSPYLLMHSHNPVNWFPWGQEALDRARQQDKPIFLSIGYSSCHWCHVIAHESFEDEEVAVRLNEDFIAIKVDKEERPDVDAVYMDAVELATGAGGWPMSILMTPAGKPFLAATYLSRDALLRVLFEASRLWRLNRAAVLEEADHFAGMMGELANRDTQRQVPDAALTERALADYAARYDSKWGGFGRSPKFPSAHNLLFLLAQYDKTGDKDALAMAEGTLEAMYRGGMFDHIGGGFCRYSVDRQWLTPHFEKMLYDNALLLWAYARAWQVTRKPLYREVAMRTADYVLREMTGFEGEFFCSQDADSEGGEGAYYVFTRDELINLLGAEEGGRFCDDYAMTEKGNFEGKNIPNLIGKCDLQLGDDAAAARERVQRYRRDRMPLGRDDKVLTSWNALMVVAMAEASRALGEDRYREAAVRAERFIHGRLVNERGELLLRWRDGDARGQGVLADYAYYMLALIALYEAVGEGDYLRRALELAGTLMAHFADEAGGGFYMYADNAEQLITRPKDIWDAAMPSGNSCAALALFKLATHTGDAQWQRAAEEQMAFIAGAASENPSGYGFALYAISQALT